MSISFIYQQVVKGFLEIHLAEDLASSDVVDIVSDVWEGVDIQDSSLIDSPVIANDSESPIFFSNKVKRA